MWDRWSFRNWTASTVWRARCDVGAGRGLSVQNLHCSEVSRWPGDAAATLAGLRAALAPDGELVLESTPSGAYGAFYEEWCRGVEECEDGGRWCGIFCRGGWSQRM